MKQSQVTPFWSQDAKHVISNNDIEPVSRAMAAQPMVPYFVRLPPCTPRSRRGLLRLGFLGGDLKMMTRLGLTQHPQGNDHVGRITEVSVHLSASERSRLGVSPWKGVCKPWRALISISS